RAENAKLLHVVDFDGFKEHSMKNHALIKEMCESVIIPIEYTGGIRSLDDAARAFDLGVSRIVLSTLPVKDPKEFEKILQRYSPSKVAVAIDVLDGYVLIRASKEKTPISPIEHAKNLHEMGVLRFIITDVGRNGMLGGPNLALMKSIAEVVKCRITVSGGVRNKDELMDIQECIPMGIDSVIIGRALYENRFPCQKLWRLAESGIFN
ncbi:MAG: 1-(5-phosphoribosyl)-5-[(5-phosphoribosylamino)methylideneamino] imidazole-4-carboxamide isomerase, partial [Ignavibacteriales bacterium]|nr:1-(5-phosphoribosyl)-5-[(5-phosphoribosylamino)methylideneamino] imidazole-4-carboxamide isomerase [Ignavibacteriales bacterium]